MEFLDLALVLPKRPSSSLSMRLSLRAEGCPDASIEAKLNILGVKSLLDQEGISYSASTPGKIRPGANVILALDFLSFDKAEGRQLTEMSRVVPMVFIGVPRPGGALAKLFGIGSATCDEEPKLRRLKFASHPITRNILQRELRIKYTPAVLMEGAKPRAPWREVGEISLWDNHRMGPALVVQSTSPRKVFFPFNVGKVFAFHCCSHPNLRQDLDIFAPSPHATVDVLRSVLRSAILWANPRCIMARPYYWPVRKGELPRGRL
ncbi:MAG: hypothetical protein QGD94_05620, partial [Planctomycetia bacterium]|nr:hypothetical protein [Planctomycetia bacterium]